MRGRKVLIVVLKQVFKVDGKVDIGVWFLVECSLQCRFVQATPHYSEAYLAAFLLACFIANFLTIW